MITAKARMASAALAMTGKLLEVGNNKIITNTIKLITIHKGLYPLFDFSLLD